MYEASSGRDALNLCDRAAGDLVLLDWIIFPGSQSASGDLTLAGARHEVNLGDTPVELTATEFNQLRYFMPNPARASKAQILQNVLSS